MRAALASVSMIMVLTVSLGCGLISTPLPPTSTPQPAPATAAPAPTESIVIPSAAATESPAEAPIDLDAPYDENAAPQNDIVSALAKSEKDGKLVLLDFGANWCPDCLVLTKLFEDPAVKPFLEENFRVVRIDVGYGDKSLDIAQQYENPIANGIPAVVVLAPSGEIVASTRDGALANARTATAQEILTYLKTWLAQKP